MYNMTPFFYSLIFLGLLFIWAEYAYNRLISLRVRAKEAVSDIDVQLKRRYDLIPNLINAVKGYAAHEKELFEKVTEARTAAMGVPGGDLKEKARVENHLSDTLKSLFAVAENYPVLKANENFLALQEELSDTENKIQAARRFYNSTVMDLNTSIEQFPTNMIAGWFGFSPRTMFEAVKGAETAPKVDLKIE